MMVSGLAAASGLTCANVPLTWLSQSRCVQRLENVGSTAPPCAWMICRRPGHSQRRRAARGGVAAFKRATLYLQRITPAYTDTHQLYLWGFQGHGNGNGLHAHLV